MRRGKRRWRSRRHTTRPSPSAPWSMLAFVVPLMLVNFFYLELFQPSGEIGCEHNLSKLPTAVHLQELEIAPVVQIAAEGTAVDGLPVDDLTEGLKEARRVPGESDAVNLVADAKTSFAEIRHVMQASRAAGYPKINFAVVQGAKVKARASRD